MQVLGRRSPFVSNRLGESSYVKRVVPILVLVGNWSPPSDFLPYRYTSEPLIKLISSGSLYDSPSAGSSFLALIVSGVVALL